MKKKFHYSTSLTLVALSFSLYLALQLRLQSYFISHICIDVYSNTYTYMTDFPYREKSNASNPRSFW